MTIKILKKIVGIFGFKLLSKNLIKNERLLSKNDILSTDTILMNLFDQNKFNALIQIGSNDGLRFDSLNKLIKKYKPKSILVEPIKEYFDQLKINYGDYNNIFFENVAISVNNEINKLYKVDKKFHYKYGEHIKGINSFEINHLFKHGVKKNHIIEEEVKSISIGDLFKKYDFEIELLVIDAEGYDASIVTDLLINSNYRPFIIFEYIHVNHLHLEKLDKLFKEKNYKFFKIEENLICIPSEFNINISV